MKLQVSARLLILSAILILSTSTRPQVEVDGFIGSSAHLTFSSGRFRVLQATDMHICQPQGSGSAERDTQTATLLGWMIDQLKPDLVILTGDIVRPGEGGSLCDERGISEEEAWRLATQPIVSRQLPFAFAMGNHDCEGNLTKSEIVQLLAALPGSLVQSGPDHLPGVGNYELPVRASATDDVAMRLLCLDSGISLNDADALSATRRRPLSGKERHHWLEPEQLQWVQEGAEAQGRLVPRAAFMHIPLHEMGGCGEVLEGGANEPISSEQTQLSQLETFANNNFIGIFTGHDHTNDLCCKAQGVAMCYGRCSGLNADFASAPHLRGKFATGGRVIDFREGENFFETWEILEGGARTSPKRMP